MRKRLIVLGATAVAALALASIVGAANLGAPCNESGEPGNSDYAQHHIVPRAQAGLLGGELNPGMHQGFSLCNPSGK